VRAVVGTVLSFVKAERDGTEAKAAKAGDAQADEPRPAGYVVLHARPRLLAAAVADAVHRLAPEVRVGAQRRLLLYDDGLRAHDRRLHRRAHDRRLHRHHGGGARDRDADSLSRHHPWRDLHRNGLPVCLDVERRARTQAIRDGALNLCGKRVFRSRKITNDGCAGVT